MWKLLLQWIIDLFYAFLQTIIRNTEYPNSLSLGLDVFEYGLFFNKDIYCCIDNSNKSYSFKRQT